jgi:hypothetical protein
VLVNVPLIGPTINAMLGVYGTQYQQRRIDTLAEELDGVMKLLGTAVDQSFLETDEWSALVMRVFRDSMQTTDRAKVRYLAAVLAGSATAERIEPNEVEAILNALAQLTATDMVLARAFVAQMGRVNVLAGDALPEVVPNARFHAARLESAGFIERSTTGMRFQPAPYVPTPVLNQLMDMIGPLLSD